ncbi:hypothetical protein PpBr36_08627 [Pyricularia pennisetigena]|uniref:hypothetical protein n=1 Tax=Pyricularia pennisetigena TaxID=1578925 RepID=UPI00114E254A|nr:hypothetical protein PpBr36_08627 [Pyricularia pennisetigena]TLS24724.1 hypothetical protein PpBr36_08627 [Pyricularia pennisetigena]
MTESNQGRADACMSHEAHEDRMEFSVSQSRAMRLQALIPSLHMSSEFWNEPGHGVIIPGRFAYSVSLMRIGSRTGFYYFTSGRLPPPSRAVPSRVQKGGMQNADGY